VLYTQPDQNVWKSRFVVPHRFPVFYKFVKKSFYCVAFYRTSTINAGLTLITNTRQVINNIHCDRMALKYDQLKKQHNKNHDRRTTAATSAAALEYRQYAARQDECG
jgi:hypothetical protein